MEPSKEKESLMLKNEGFLRIFMGDIAIAVIVIMVESKHPFQVLLKYFTFKFFKKPINRLCLPILKLNTSRFVEPSQLQILRS